MIVSGRLFVIAVVALACLSAAAPSEATEWFVESGGTGNGTSSSPFGRIQDGIEAALAGDTITVRAGTYAESLRTVRAGTKGAVIKLRTTGARGTVLVSVPARVLTVSHAYFQVDGLVFDAQYAAADAIRVDTGAHYFVLRNSEVRRSTRDLIDMGSPQGVLIEHCLVHRALNAANGRTDAHGIVAGAVRNLTIRNTEIHTFSGDGLQLDPNRAVPGWNTVTLDSVRIWLAPLEAPENGFAAGVVPGENAIDTKANINAARATLTIRNVTAWGFRNGLITNMAAFNLKENINATLDRVTVYDSEIAFRVRGITSSTPVGAWATIKNAVVYDTATAYRYEEDLQNLRVWNNTIGGGVSRAFRAANSDSVIDVRNTLFLGTRPAEASHSSNLAVQSNAFIAAARHDYRLAMGSPAIDAGTTLTGVATDRRGVRRPFGSAYDVGGYEWLPTDAGEVVVHARAAAVALGDWRVEPDPSAAGGSRITHPDRGMPAVTSARKVPSDYFEVLANVEAGRTYRLWLRGQAERNASENDSVFVQFSGSVSSSGKAIYRIGTSSALVVNLEDCSGCGLSGWGWQDTGQGVEYLGPTISFAQSGLQTVRIQTREDGVSIDQIVLSPVEYLTTAPGALRDDTTVLAE